MLAAFNWNISQLDCIPDVDGKQDYVVTAHWQCNGSEVSGDKTYTARVYGTASFSVESGETFTPYEDLTQEQVLGWVWSQVNKEETEANVSAQLQNQINPPIVSPPLPWKTAP